MAKQYATNVVLQSPVTGAYYFVPKVELLGGGMSRVVGKKYDVTASMEALFGPMLERERKRILRQRSRNSGGRRRG